MKIWTSLWLTLALSANVYANSFVGNGGNQGDVELAVTLMQIRETFVAIEKRAGDNPPALCECNKVFKGRPVCEPLAALSAEQTTYCDRSLYQVAPLILKTIDNRDQIHFRWTNSTIEVNDAGKARDSDAVADPEHHEITINQKRFLKLRPAERVFLLTHELMHYATLDGKPLGDKGAVGPFQGEDGSRTLINAMSSTAAVMPGTYPKEIKGYGAKLHRSQAWKPFWLTADFGTASATSKYSDNFQFNSYQRAQLTLRYQWTHWGVMAAYRHEWQDGSVLDSIKTTETIDSIGIGPTYRFFMSSDPLTFWGQSHILIHTLIESVHARYKYNEQVAGAPHDLGDSFSTTVLGANLGVSYYLPLFFGTWTYLGVSYRS